MSPTMPDFTDEELAAIDLALLMAVPFPLRGRVLARLAGTDQIAAGFSSPESTWPVGVLNCNARMQRPEQPVDLSEAQRPIADWLKSKGFLEDRFVLAYCWSTREGYDYTDLEFYPWANDKYPSRFSAIIGHHASGDNPRTIIGTVDTLAEVQMVCKTIRLINGYKQPEDYRLAPVSGTDPIARGLPCPTCQQPMRELSTSRWQCWTLACGEYGTIWAWTRIQP